MRKILCPLLFLPFLLLAKDPYTPDGTIDVLHYKFTQQVDLKTKVLAAEAEVRVRFLINGLEKIKLDLDDPNADGTGMLVSKVLMGGLLLAYEQKDDKLIIDLPNPASTQTDAHFSIEYSGVPFDGLIIRENKFREVTAFGDNWPNRAHHWLPVVDHPSDKATVEFIVTAPKGYHVVANGKLVSETKGKKKATTFHWKNEVPISTKVMVMGMANFNVIENGTVGNTPVSTWVYQKNAKEGAVDFAAEPGILKLLVDYIGEYPYAKLAHVQSTTRYGGMENAGNIFYDEKAITGNRRIDRLIAHETVHQWFGNSVTEKDWHHIWLSEGFATYLTMVYVEQAMGPDSMKSDLKKARDRVLNFHERNPQSSIIDTTIVNLNQLLSPNTYQKAAWFLHMLRQKIGDEPFQEVIQTYYEEYRNGNALTADFQAVVAKVHGNPLQTFFEEWLYRPGVPVIEWTWGMDNYSGDRVAIKVTQAQPLRYEDIFLEFDIYLKGQEKPIRKTLEVIYNNKEYSFLMPSAVEKVVADPDCKLLFKEVLKEN